MKKHYVLFSCDQWKSNDSMRLIGVFTRYGLSRVVAKRALKGDFEIDSLKKPSASDIAKYCYINDLNNDLTYGYVEEVDINEEL